MKAEMKDWDYQGKRPDQVSHGEIQSIFLFILSLISFFANQLVRRKSI